MFTGIVEEIGTIVEIRNDQSVRTLIIKAERIIDDMHIGDSISVNGTCLTVTDFNSNHFSVQVIHGTEDKTYLANVQRHQEVNLERAMHSNGRFGGHFVLGHVDELGTITKINQTADSKVIQISASQTIIKQLVKQGSIAVDGVSLTVFDIRESSFDIHLIPETRRSTILADKKQGDFVHLETDVLFKYVAKIINKNSNTLTLDKLKSYGF